MLVSIIVAVSKNGVIGRDNQLIWHLPDDLKQFKRLTMNHPMIMGRKTFESIGKPLPGRTSIVVSRSSSWPQDVALQNLPSLLVAGSLEAAIELAKQNNPDEVFVIGGAEIYRLALPLAHKIYLTEVHVEVLGDAFFEISDPENWHEVSRTSHISDEKHAHSFDFITLLRHNTN
jgi:dihydrofolate reductase